MKSSKWREGGRDRDSDSERARERKRGRVEREDDIMLIGLKLHGPSGISLPLTDVRDLSGIKHYQQEDFQLRAAGRA